MKAIWVSLLAGVIGMWGVLIGDSFPALGEPKGEITIATEYMGYEVPIPYVEMAQGLDYMKLLYDPLMGVTPDGRLMTDQGVAEKREMSADALTWTFYLRKGVKFHDGTELTAKDVKFSLEQTMRPDAIQPNSIEIKKVLKSVEVKDPYTLVVHCKVPTPFFDNLVSDMDSPGGSMIVPKDYYERVGKDQFQKHPVGSGPYKFHSQVVGSYIRLEATDRHWRDGVPRYKYVNFPMFTNQSIIVWTLKTKSLLPSLYKREELPLFGKEGRGEIFRRYVFSIMDSLVNLHSADPSAPAASQSRPPFIQFALALRHCENPTFHCFIRSL